MTFNPPTFLPPVLAIGQGNASNGRQQLGSGLVTHRGIIDSNSIRGTGRLYPQSGAGVEVQYDQTAKTGYVIAYDRDAAAYTDLNIGGQNISLNPHAPGKLILPAGTAQALIGNWLNPSGWTVPAINQWLESDVRASFTSTGGPWRIEFACAITSPTKGGTCYVGLGVDGAITWPSVQLLSVPETNYIVPVAGFIYHQSPPAAGPHRVSIWLYASTASTGFNAGANAGLWVTEQRA